ncbi:MAG: hypothetical protein M3Y28_08235 [Armatimonadota bacterium]|nr:hypothetical protein [Armatimonadota bacterium]
MTNYWERLWQRVSGQEMNSDGEVERIAALQRAASLQRADYAQKREQAKQTGDASLEDALSSSRRKMEEAESAHAAALQKWNNKESRQKSR